MPEKRHEDLADLSVIGVDIGKDTFHLAWLTRAAERMHRNKLGVALANKLARTAWSVLRHGTEFDERGEAAMAV